MTYFCVFFCFKWGEIFLNLFKIVRNSQHADILYNSSSHFYHYTYLFLPNLCNGFAMFDVFQILNKTAIIWCQTYKALFIFDWFWSRPGLDGFYFGVVCRYTLLWNHMAQKDYLFLEEGTLGGFQLEISLQQSVEKMTQTLQPLCKGQDGKAMSSM